MRILRSLKTKKKDETIMSMPICTSSESAHDSFITIKEHIIS